MKELVFSMVLLGITLLVPVSVQALDPMPSCESPSETAEDWIALFPGIDYIFKGTFDFASVPSLNCTGLCENWVKSCGRRVAAAKRCNQTISGQAKNFALSVCRTLPNGENIFCIEAVKVEWDMFKQANEQDSQAAQASCEDPQTRLDCEVHCEAGGLPTLCSE